MKKVLLTSFLSEGEGTAMDSENGKQQNNAY